MDIGDDLLVYEQDDASVNEPVNISDVLDAITNADPSFGGGAVEMAQAPALPPASVEIVEQPAPRALRFRYECEGRSAGSIPGVNSTPENKTYPTIRINNYVGTVTIVVSCVNKDPPFTPHPHNLVGRDRCQRGVCTIKRPITEEQNEYQFKNLGIQCVKKRDIPEALNVRASLRVDPFRTGFDHRNNPQSIDLNAVRLAFQVFLQDPTGGRLCQLRPVVSDVIYDKKAMTDPQIMRASHCSGPIGGGTQVILLCEKVIREDIAVIFYEEDDSGHVVWEQAATTLLVHKLFALVFEVPPYAHPHSTQHHTVLFQLKRPSDNTRSNSLPFEYIPDFRKRKMLSPILSSYESERYNTDHPVKNEPNQTPPQIYSPPAPGYGEQSQQHWSPAGLSTFPDPGHDFPQWGTQYPAGQPSPAQYQGAQGHVSPGYQGAQGQLSPAYQGAQGQLSPAYQGAQGQVCPSPRLQPLTPRGRLSPRVVDTMSPMAQQMSPMGQLSPMQPPGVSQLSPLGQDGALSPALQQMQQQQQQMMQQQMMQQRQMQHAYPAQVEDPQLLMSSGPSLSTLLGGDTDMYSLPGLGEDRENLSDSLRQLSTNDLLFNKFTANKQ